MYIGNGMCYTPQQLCEFVHLLLPGGPKIHNHNIWVYISTYIWKNKAPTTDNAGVI